MRLPGSVAEIEASPSGPEVGAFFDLDGTLVAGFTGVIMTQDRLRRRQMSVGEFIGMVQAGLNHQLGRSEFEDLIGKGARMLRGNSLDDIDELAERLFVQKIVGRIYPEMRELVRAHMARGHTVVLSSSALTVQVEPVARFLGIENVLSNKFETDEHGRLTGEVLTPIIWGPGKARAVQAFAAEKRCRPVEELLLRRRRRRRRADVPRRQSAADQSRGQARRGRRQTRLAGVEIQQPQWQQPGLAIANGRRYRVDDADRRRRHRPWPADPQQAHRRQLLHVDVWPDAADRHRDQPQRAGQGEPDRPTAGGVHLQPPQPGRSDDRRDVWSRTTSRRSARRSWRTTRSSAPWARSWTPPSSTATTPRRPSKD